MTGKVYLIGAGPGDPGLLTLKGQEILAKADAVVYDALINPQILQWAKPRAQKIFVGKRGRHHVKEQTEINAILARLASKGLLVARLKGGDPFMFARGGEEAGYLAEAKISFEVIPGVTSALGASAYAGIPLTHRRFNSMVTFVTGFEGRGKRASPVEWSRISRQSTLVIFMGLGRLAKIFSQLRQKGWKNSVPAAAIEWGTLPHQRVVEGTVETLPRRVQEAGLRSPVLIVIGHVVSERKKLNWFARKPLDEKTILVTRPAGQAAGFSERLSQAGAQVLAYPAIAIRPPRTWKPVDTAIQNLRSFDWLLFTSTNGVTAFHERLQAKGIAAQALQKIRIGAIGPKTSAALKGLGLKVKALPENYRAEALADALGTVKGQKILLARAQEAREILPKTLRARGAHVTVATVYQTLKPRRIPKDIKRLLVERKVDVVTFTSSSTVEGLLQHFTSAQRRRIFSRTKAAAIGPITAATLRRYGVRPTIQAPLYTTESLAEAIVHYFSR